MPIFLRGSKSEISALLDPLVTHRQYPGGDFHRSPLAGAASESQFVVDAAFIASDQEKFAIGFFVPAPWMLKRRPATLSITLVVASL